GGRKPCRSGADDDQIVELRWIESHLESGAATDFRERRVGEVMAVTREHDRCRRRGDTKLPEQGLGLLIRLEIDPCEWDRVPSRKIAEAVRIRRESRTDDFEALEPLAQKERAPREKGLEHDFAEVRQRVHR